MKPSEQKRFDKLYRQHLRALKLNGKSLKTIDVYSRGVRRLTARFDRVPDKITGEQFAIYFSELVDSHSWSTVRSDRNGIQFFWKHVLKKQWKWVDIVKPPSVQSIPDILSVAEVHQLLQSTRLLRYRVFFLCTYSMGLRLAETASLQLGDIDSANQRVHIHRGKGAKDRFIPLGDYVLQQMRLLWMCHQHPKYLFPSTKSLPAIQSAKKPISHGTVQQAFKKVVDECGFKKKLLCTPSGRYCHTTSAP